MGADLEVEWDHLSSTQLALVKFGEGKLLRHMLSSGLFRQLKPAETEVRRGLLSIRHGGIQPTHGEPLRQTVHRAIQVEQVFPDPASAGARILIGQTPQLRFFQHAARALNARRGWVHRTFGHKPVVHQVGRPGFFDHPIQDRQDNFRKVVEEIMDEFARLIRAEARKGGKGE